MIQVTRLDGSVMVVNVDQIAWIEGMPDTVISLMNGEKLLVREAPDQLVERAKAFKRAIVTPAVRRSGSFGEVVDMFDADAATGSAQASDEEARWPR
jgi:flagellar protein FlbD